MGKVLIVEDESRMRNIIFDYFSTHGLICDLARNGKEALDILKEHYRLYLVSNGTFSVQHRRLTDSGLYPYFQQVFISEQIGADKPSAAFFDHCFAHMDHPDRSKTLIIGDSMTSDMLGGIRAGLRTCWVNPGHLPRKYEVDYEIESLVQLPDLLKNA